MSADLLRQGRARAWLEAGIVHVEFPAGARIVLAMTEDVYQQRLALLDSAPGPQKVLAWGTRVINLDYAASRFTAGKPTAKITRAMAIVVQNTLERSLASMFMHMFRPAYPVALFEDRAAALAWLATFPDP